MLAQARDGKIVEIEWLPITRARVAAY